MEKEQTFRKPNSTLVMIPRIGRLTPVIRKMFNVMMYFTQEQVKLFSMENREIPAKHLFAVPLSDVLGSMTNGDSDARTLAKKHLREMRKIEVDWEAPDASSGIVWTSMNLLSEVDLEIRDGETWVLWAFPPSLLIALSDPERYTALNLVEMAKLNGYTAIALYEVCSRYRNNPTGVTSKNSWEWWVDALSMVPATIDPKTGLKKQRPWRKLKEGSVNAAIDEINEKTDITIGLLEFKKVRAVAEVQFTIQKKRVDGTAAKNKTAISASLAEYAAKLDINLEAIAKMLRDGHPEVELKIGLAKLDARLKRSELDPVDNRLAFLKQLIKNADGQAKLSYIVAQSPSVAPEQTEPPLEVLKTLKEERFSKFKNELFSLDRNEQQRFAFLALEALKKTGLATPSFSRKIHAGDWQTGMLLNKVIDTYAIETYGQHCWDEPKLANNK